MTDSIIWEGIALYPDEVGRLWVFLADYYTWDGWFEEAWEIYEEALEKI